MSAINDGSATSFCYYTIPAMSRLACGVTNPAAGSTDGWVECEKCVIVLV